MRDAGGMSSRSERCLVFANKGGGILVVVVVVVVRSAFVVDEVVIKEVSSMAEREGVWWKLSS